MDNKRIKHKKDYGSEIIIDTINCFPDVKISFKRKFNDKLKLNYYCFEKDGYYYANVWYDFGMEVEIPLDKEHNELIKCGFMGLTNDSLISDKIKYSIMNDIYISFMQSDNHPMYKYLHWAIKGFLSKRIKITSKMKGK